MYYDNSHDGVYVVIVRYDGEDLEIKTFRTLADVKAQVHDTLMMGARRARVYRVYPDPDGGQLSERIERFDYDKAPTAAAI